MIPPKRYIAMVPRSDISVYLQIGWDLDEDVIPTGGRVGICWRRAEQPRWFPLGWRVVVARMRQ